MTSKSIRGRCICAIAILVITSAQTVFACPPLLCKPLDTGNSPSLAWGGSGWQSVEPGYNLYYLTEETLALLTKKVPVIARMETLRRAAIYAATDRETSSKLFARILARATKADKKRKANALVFFDVGYLAELYKQARDLPGSRIADVNADGYAYIKKALQARGPDPEMEFAAALLTLNPKRESHDQHLREAISGAAEESLLAANLITQFNDRGKTLAELKASVGIPKD